MSSVLHGRLAELAALEHAADRALGASVAKIAEPVATTGGDPQLLRGIPAIGRCVSGAIRGTDPVKAVIR